MTVQAHVFPSFNLALLEKSSGITNYSGSSHLAVLLVAGSSNTYTSTNANFGTCTNVANFLTVGDGTNGALTEVTGGSYARITNIGTVTVTDTGTGSSSLTTLSCANPVWSTVTFTAKYALFYDHTSGSDSTDQVLCYWDFGGSQSVSGANFTLTISGSGLITWASS
jgi:hypothetical protein